MTPGLGNYRTLDIDVVGYGPVPDPAVGLRAQVRAEIAEDDRDPDLGRGAANAGSGRTRGTRYDPCAWRRRRRACRGTGRTGAPRTAGGLGSTAITGRPAGTAVGPEKPATRPSDGAPRADHADRPARRRPPAGPPGPPGLLGPLDRALVDSGRDKGRRRHGNGTPFGESRTLRITSGAKFVLFLLPHRLVTARHAQDRGFADPVARHQATPCFLRIVPQSALKVKSMGYPVRLGSVTPQRMS